MYELEKIEGLPLGTLSKDRLAEFDMFIRDPKKNVWQRCPCCHRITHGVNVVGSN